MKSIKKLVAVEFEVEKDDEPYIHEIGAKYVYLQDPKTGRFYEPNPGWEVTGENLEKLFRQIYANITDE
jgi:hypothetical protein